ncbi:MULTISPECIES: DUF6328 family protein [unclassified Streptomyces]|uniref:DUF6328 family protein n=1 Tax=unclassified Streptomyces TaxID=2593676 RepID=UPI003815CD8F
MYSPPGVPRPGRAPSTLRWASRYRKAICIVTVVLGACATGVLIGPVSFSRLASGRRIEPEAVRWTARLTLAGWSCSGTCCAGSCSRSGPASGSPRTEARGSDGRVPAARPGSRLRGSLRPERRS